jgi:hypothetical protein
MEILNWIFFGPAMLIAALPYAGFLIGVILLAGQAIRTLRLSKGAFDRAWFREPPVLAGLIWLIFNLYELQVAAVFAEKNPPATPMLRLDLLVVAPILYVLTGLAIYVLLTGDNVRRVEHNDKDD